MCICAYLVSSQVSHGHFLGGVSAAHKGVYLSSLCLVDTRGDRFLLPVKSDSAHTQWLLVSRLVHTAGSKWPTKKKKDVQNNDVGGIKLVYNVSSVAAATISICSARRRSNRNVRMGRWQKKQCLCHHQIFSRGVD